MQIQLERRLFPASEVKEDKNLSSLEPIVAEVFLQIQADLALRPVVADTSRFKAWIDKGHNFPELYKDEKFRRVLIDLCPDNKNYTLIRELCVHDQHDCAVAFGKERSIANQRVGEMLKLIECLKSNGGNNNWMDALKEVVGQMPRKKIAVYQVCRNPLLTFHETKEICSVIDSKPFLLSILSNKLTSLDKDTYLSDKGELLLEIFHLLVDLNDMNDRLWPRLLKEYLERKNVLLAKSVKEEFMKLYENDLQGRGLKAMSVFAAFGLLDIFMGDWKAGIKNIHLAFQIEKEIDRQTNDMSMAVRYHACQLNLRHGSLKGLLEIRPETFSWETFMQWFKNRELNEG